MSACGPALETALQTKQGFGVLARWVGTDLPVPINDGHHRVPPSSFHGVGNTLHHVCLKYPLRFNVNVWMPGGDFPRSIDFIERSVRRGST